MKSDLESLGRLRMQGLLLLIALFAVGALAGTAFERARQKGALPERPPHDQGGPLPPGWREDFNLTAEQEKQIESILIRGRTRTDVVLDQFLPLLREVADSIRAEIRMVLTPDQQKLFDEHEPRIGPDPMGAPPPNDGFPHPGPPPGHGGHPPGRPPAGDRPPPRGDAPPPPREGP